MNWYYTPGWWEYICIGLFTGLYLLYVFRVVYLARMLQSSIQPLIAKFILRSFYFGLLVIALLGPSFGGLKKEVKAMGKDIYILVDLSQSMNANDMAPTRLERVKFEIEKFVHTLHTDRIGLIIFAEEAFVQCPLTFDKNTLLLFIETLKTGLMPTGSTNFEAALQLAFEKHTDTTNTSLSNQAKIILLFSDGEDFGDRHVTLLRQISNAGIRLFTVGVGTTTGGKIPSGKSFKKDNDGKEVITILQREHLLRMTERNGGNYYEINNTEDNMAELAQAIQNIEGQLLDTKDIEATANKYYYFLLVALLCMIVDIVIVSRTIHL
ncbi:VWA domain-containing protein [Rhodocytophaga rosea]|uniref:VWA domain-containing protein n=1 Tax=Rhodocytophaga rosea TaxID=2704465 RepID=A0A6C0GQH3_9BACT|nr:VWA domain-containing protein [Rhodocytophaga rosea]QHT69760.1 VWA domain-containing protein [Rhodocytophaga rosea]